MEGTRRNKRRCFRLEYRENLVCANAKDDGSLLRKKREQTLCLRSSEVSRQGTHWRKGLRTIRETEPH